MDFFNRAAFFTLNAGGRLIDLTEPKLMGILNVTPDSFSDGDGDFSPLKIMRRAEKLVAEGASVLDIGPQSTRPNAEKISSREEMTRLGTLISELKKNFPEVLLSLDTFYSETLRFGFDQGIDIANDVSGGQWDPAMLPTVAELKMPYVLMHVAEHYDQMHEKDENQDIVLAENLYFSKKIESLLALGIKDIILDPGFGFGKTVEQNHQLLDELQFLNFGQFPVLVGISRKSFIYKPLGRQPLEISAETEALHLKALNKGAKFLRVHDVAAAQNTLQEFLQGKAN